MKHACSCGEALLSKCARRVQADERAPTAWYAARRARRAELILARWDGRPWPWRRLRAAHENGGGGAAGALPDGGLRRQQGVGQEDWCDGERARPCSVTIHDRRISLHLSIWSSMNALDDALACDCCRQTVPSAWTFAEESQRKLEGIQPLESNARFAGFDSGFLPSCFVSKKIRVCMQGGTRTAKPAASCSGAPQVGQPWGWDLAPGSS